MVNFLGLAENAYVGARKWVKPKSFEGLRYIPKTLEKDVVEFTQKPTIVGVPLDKTSEACNFFGVDSYENLVNKVQNHEKLYKAKHNWCINTDIGCIENYMDVYMSPKGIEKFRRYLTEPITTRVGTWTRFKELVSQKAARMTCFSEIFGKDPYGYPAAHTVGLVVKNGNLYILDSLGEQVPVLKEFHKMLADTFKDFGFRKIIISTKSQQPITEYTCNNWTYANIESTLKAMIEKRMEINTPEELNKILPEDINKILKAQQNSVIWTD